jgi:hypothetical protein
MRGKRALAFSLISTLQIDGCKGDQINMTMFIMFMIIVICPGLSRGKTAKIVASATPI